EILVRQRALNRLDLNLDRHRLLADKGYSDVALFEVSGTYENDRQDGQRRVAGGIRRGTASLAGAGRAWSNTAKGGGKPVDVF
ncbi:hypothetical protein ACC675_37585, partial [Rhizobium ruizarguesonis]